MENQKEIAVMFSGGTDSTYAAWSQMPHYDRIHLVSFLRHGFRKLQNPEGLITRLRELAPEKEITYRQIDFESIYQQITPHREKRAAQQGVLSQTMSPLWEDPHGNHNGRKEYEQNRQRLFMANECLQCKIAMHIAAIKFCIEENIHDICDGSNAEQLDDGSQLEDVKPIAAAIFKKLGVNYFSPSFHVPQEERCRVLHTAGITDHLNHKQLEKTHQIPSQQIQCTVPASVLWTACIFPWLVYDGRSCNEYIQLCCDYYASQMEKGLQLETLRKVSSPPGSGEDMAVHTIPTHSKKGTRRCS